MSAGCYDELVGGVSVTIPRRLVEELERRGIDVGSAFIDLASIVLNLDPQVIAEAHLELALKYLEEGKSLVDRDSVQASEKLYKAAEEVVKALTVHFNLESVLRDVERSGRWSVAKLEEAVEAISERVGEWFRHSWDSAWVLHVWGFHEAKLNSKAVKLRLPDVEKMISEAQEIVKKQGEKTGISPVRTP
jgi:exonuclease VII small subunit